MVQPSQLHGLCHGCCDSAHLIGLGAFLHDPMQHLQQLCGVFLSVDIEVLNNLLVGFMDVVIRRARLVSPGSQSTGNATVCFYLVPTGRHTSSICPRLFRTVQPGLPARTAARNPLSQAAPLLVFAMGHFLPLMTAMLSSHVL